VQDLSFILILLSCGRGVRGEGFNSPSVGEGLGMRVSIRGDFNILCLNIG